MTGGARTEAACLDAAMAEIPRQFTYPYGYGYLTGAIEEAILRLAYAEPASVIADLKRALEAAKMGERP